MAITGLTVSNILSSGFEFKEAESQLLFRFRTLNYFMLIAMFFGALIGILGEYGLMKIGVIQPKVNVIYAFFNVTLVLLLRQNKEWFKRIAWAQVISSLIVFVFALATVVNDEFRIAWFYVSIYLAYMLLGQSAGNRLTFFSIIVIVLLHVYLELELSDTAIATAVFSLIVFGLLSRVYTTQIKNYENELKSKNEDLAKSINNLDVALEDAEAASKTKSLFLANMSHEIRTPMNGILSLVQVLQTTKLEEKQQDYLHSVHRAGGILMSLIDDLLDLSRIESGKLKLNIQAFKFWDFLDDVLFQVEHLFDDKNVHFNVDIDDTLPACFIADDVRLKQVVINLINNAAKFTSEGEVNLLMTGSQQNDIYNLHIEVSDTGIGIPEEKVLSIFEPFHQISASRIYNKGVGLGLPISKKIIDALGGEIRIDSVEGHGSTFSLDFFFYTADESDIEEENIETNIELAALNILLVEDDEISRIAVQTLLSDKGHKVVIAENGCLGITYLKNNNVDVILMDVHMPEMNGVEATKIIKGENLSAAPIIGMTASVMNDERKSYIEAGMDVLVEKPINFKKLMEHIQRKLKV